MHILLALNFAGAPLYLLANTSMYTLGLRRLLVLHSPCCFCSSIRLVWCLQARVICRQISNLWMFIRPSRKNVGCGNSITDLTKLFLLPKLRINVYKSFCRFFLLSDNKDASCQFSLFGISSFSVEIIHYSNIEYLFLFL